MLARDFPVWIARDRAAGRQGRGRGRRRRSSSWTTATRTPRSRKTLSLVVVDGETRDDEWPFGDGRVFPAGPMREPLKAGLARADAVVVLLPADLAAADPELVRALLGASRC